MKYTFFCIITAFILLNLQYSWLLDIEEVIDFRKVSLESKEKDKYYNGLHRYNKKFEPVSQSYIDSIRFIGIDITFLNHTSVPFTSAWEPTPIREKYEQMAQNCFVQSKGSKSDSCLQSIWELEESDTIEAVRKSWIVRMDSVSTIKAMLYHGRDGYYTIGIFQHGQWRHYFTGLPVESFYFLKSRSQLPFIVNDSTFQIEVAQIRMVKQAVLPAIPPEYELLKDCGLLTFHLDELRKDSDKDGLEDIWEQRCFTNPLDADTDNDGLSDSMDTNPLNKSKRNEYTVLYQYLLEHIGIDSCFVQFDDTTLACEPEFLRKMKKRRPVPRRTICLVTENPALKELIGVENRY
ncbi:hypothetical protein QNI16_28070 [Cytophagaceae bacterium YF14B1]|uniref:Uncharacterized protein n=1 Tax=Xanthocytophaga flava TaxID=3048013 RepID=A0AAE3QS07_9BACT|nr:hypothetical protein [Xanthocytophaga flavus]MDJ1484387.1 hypothetical protein [Xanthocytophaga flavus]